MSDLIKKEEQTTLLKGGKLKSTGSSFQNRVRQNQVDISELPNRICLMLDCSSSMSTHEKDNKRRIDLLKEALENFVNRCDYSNTAVAVETFPPSIEVPLTNIAAVLSGCGFGLEASGNTPMQACVGRCIGKVPMTRGVIVSDGEATDWYNRDELRHDDEDRGGGSVDSTLKQYIEQKIPIDCVHISTDSGGEELLRWIAKTTGGIFLKFTDVSAFASSFGYLTPGYRAMLTNGRVSASELGAKELR